MKSEPWNLTRLCCSSCKISGDRSRGQKVVIIIDTDVLVRCGREARAGVACWWRCNGDWALGGRTRNGGGALGILYGSRRRRTSLNRRGFGGRIADGREGKKRTLYTLPLSAP